MKIANKFPGKDISIEDIKTKLATYKEDTLDLNGDRIQEFNEKYLGLTQSQLINIKDLFLKDEYEINTMFLIKKYFTINERFSIENGMLTPTLKLKRYKIISKYKNNFENLY